MDFEMILGVPFFYSNSQSIMLWSIHIRFESRFRQFPQVSDFVEILGNGKLGKFSILGNNFCIRHGHYDTDELEQNQLFQSKLDIQGDLSSNENIPPLLPNPFFKINWLVRFLRIFRIGFVIWENWFPFPVQQNVPVALMKHPTISQFFFREIVRCNSMYLLNGC